MRSALSQAETARRADLARRAQGDRARGGADAACRGSSTWTRTNAVFFAKDTDYRDPQAAAAALDELAALIKDTDVLVRVVGYTDEKGGEERNTPLSQARAEKVMAELSTRGIAPRAWWPSAATTAPTSSTIVGDASPNRRVEFEIGFAGEGPP